MKKAHTGEPAIDDGQHTSETGRPSVQYRLGKGGAAIVSRAVERRGRETKMATQASRISVVIEGPGNKKG